MSARNHNSSFVASITDVSKVEKIVDYSFERNEKSNVLAFHPTRPLIAYLINIQRTQKISKAWSSGNDSAHSPSVSSINGQSNSADKNKTVSIRIIDYVTRQRCLAKGIYHARPTECVFTINSLICSQSELIKLAVVDRLANVYLYDLSYILNELTATRVAVIRSPSHEVSPYDNISLVWCPFVPCEDFDDGDGGLRLALSTNSRIEIFAIDRLQGRTGELQRDDLKGAYKCINDAHGSNIVALSISPDCSTISAASIDNRITFFSSDIDDSGQRCLHKWDASMTDSPIAKLFFLDDYPKLLEDSNMKFWGTAFIGTRGGQMLLIDLRTWTVYQKMHLNADPSSSKNFDYRIDLTARNVVAINGNQCYVVRIESDNNRSSSQSSTASDVGMINQNDTSLLDSNQTDLMNGHLFDYLLSKPATTTARTNHKQENKKHSNASNSSNSTVSSGLPKIVRTTCLSLHNSIYSFVIKNKSNNELELFTISAYSLELHIINLTALEVRMKASEPPSQPVVHPQNQLHQLLQMQHQQLQQPLQIQQSLQAQQIQKHQTPDIQVNKTLVATEPVAVGTSKGRSPVKGGDLGGKVAVDVSQMDRMVEILFTKLNTSFSQGLDEFLGEIKCEVNDLKLKLNGLCRDVSKLQLQLQEMRQK